MGTSGWSLRRAPRQTETGVGLDRDGEQVSRGKTQSARCCRCWPGPCSGGRTTTASTRGGCKEQEQGMCGSPNKDEYVAWGGAVTKGMVEAGGR